MTLRRKGGCTADGRASDAHSIHALEGYANGHSERAVNDDPIIPGFELDRAQFALKTALRFGLGVYAVGP